MPRSTCCCVVGDAVTPGCSSVSWLKSRPFNGSSRTWRSSTSAAIDDWRMLTSAVSPATTTCSSTPPTFICTDTTASWPTASTMSGTRAVRKPWSSTLNS